MVDVAPHEELLRLAKPGLVLNSNEERWVHKLSEMLKMFLLARFRLFVAENCDQPVAITFGNDCTPLSVQQRFHRQYGDFVAVRHGGHTADFIIQRMWAQNLKGQSSVLYYDPREMEDKTAAAHWTAARELAGFAVEMGCRSLNIQHYVMDRAIYTAQCRLLQQAHARRVRELATNVDGKENPMLGLLSWFVCSGCCDHDVHNSLKRSFAQELEDKSFVKRVWKCSAGLRKGFSYLVQHVGGWLACSIKWEAWAFSRKYQLWTMLGLPSDLCDELAELGLICVHGSLLVDPRFQGDGAVLQRIVVLLLKVWEFREWTDSRWLSLGPACKSLTSSRLLGMPALVAYVLRQPHVAAWTLGMYKMDEDISTFVTKVAGGSFVSDAAMAVLVEDDRVPLLWEKLVESMDEELMYLSDLPGDVWDALAVGCSISGRSLQHQCIQGSYLQASFIRWRLRPATRHPWSLTIGDRTTNLLKLASGPPPEDRTSWKIQRLMLIGFPLEQMLEGVELLSRLSWSSKTVEEGHASASTLMKLHRRYGLATMKSRAMIIQSRALFQRNRSHNQLARVDARLEKLRRRNPDKITGKGIWISQLFRTLKEQKQRGKLVRRGTTNHLIRVHGRQWDKLTKTAQHRYLSMARDARAKGWATLGEQLEVAANESSRIRSQLDVERVCNGPLRLSTCALSNDEIERFDEMWDHLDFSHSKVGAAQVEAAKALKPPSAEELDLLAEMPVALVPETGDSPGWARNIASRPRAFLASVLRLTLPSREERFRKVLFSLQRPHVVGFLSVQPEDEIVRHPDEHGLFDDASWAHTFRVEHGCYSFSDDEEYQTECEVHVLTDTTWQGSFALVSDSDWRVFETVLQITPGHVVQDHGSGARHVEQRVGSAKGKLLEEFPWLADIHGRQQQGCGGGGACHKLVAPKRLHSGDSDVDVCVDDQACSSSECDDSSSVDEGSAMEKLLAKRAKMEK